VHPSTGDQAGVGDNVELAGTTDRPISGYERMLPGTMFGAHAMHRK